MKTETDLPEINQSSAADRKEHDAPAAPEERRCYSCMFWEARRIDWITCDELLAYGLCRKSPPVLVASRNPEDPSGWEWPKTYFDDVCGKYIQSSPSSYIDLDRAEDTETANLLDALRDGQLSTGVLMFIMEAKKAHPSMNSIEGIRRLFENGDIKKIKGVSDLVMSEIGKFLYK